jgi:hypothetical protein
VNRAIRSGVLQLAAVAVWLLYQTDDTFLDIKVSIV